MGGQREFILAMTMFVLMAIVGTAFGLWFTFQFGSAHVTPQTIDQRR